MRELLGGKGANLAEMTSLGMPVPQGFTVTTEACTKYYEDGRSIGDEIMGQVYEALARLKPSTTRNLATPEAPAGLRPFRRPGLHARHDGHHPEPRPQRRGRRRSHRR